MGRPKAGPQRLLQAYFGYTKEEQAKLDELRGNIPRHVYLRAILTYWLSTNPEVGKLP